MECSDRAAHVTHGYYITFTQLLELQVMYVTFKTPTVATQKARSL